MPGSPEAPSPTVESSNSEFVGKFFDSLTDPSNLYLTIRQREERAEKARQALNRELDSKQQSFLNPPVLKIGDVYGGRRTPARTSGTAEAGRVPGLHWNVIADPAQPDVPPPIWSALQSIQSEIHESSLKVIIASAPLPFLSDCILWHFWIPQNKETNPHFDVDAFLAVVMERKPDQITLTSYELTWKNEPLYRLNRKAGFRFSRDPFSYARYFMHLLRGPDQQYPFTLLESEQDLLEKIPWDSDRPDDVWKAQDFFRPIIKPIQRDYMNAAGDNRISGVIFYGNAIFTSRIAVNSAGHFTMEDDEVQGKELGDLPVLSQENDRVGVG